MKKRIVCLLVAVLMACALCVPASAAEETAHNHAHYIKYISRSEDGTVVESFGLFCEKCREFKHIMASAPVIDYHISYNGWGVGGKETWYFVEGIVTLKDPVRIYGTVNLVLLDDALLICERGIHIYDGGTLNLYSEHLDYSPDTDDNHMGRLRAYTHEKTDYGAAIGGMWDDKEVTVNIYGGDIYALSEGFGAAIGSGFKGKATVNICGGKVRAFSTNDGAGIGGGYDETTATVNFRGGIVWASSGDSYAASVGNGFWECHSQVTFSGGFVYAVPSGGKYTKHRGFLADSIVKEGDYGIIGKDEDGLYDSEGMKLAKQAGWVEQNGGYVGATIAQGNWWILLGVAILAVSGVAVFVVVRRKKKPSAAESGQAAQ